MSERIGPSGSERNPFRRLNDALTTSITGSLSAERAYQLDRALRISRTSKIKQPQGDSSVVSVAREMLDVTQGDFREGNHIIDHEAFVVELRTRWEALRESRAGQYEQDTTQQLDQLFNRLIDPLLIQQKSPLRKAIEEPALVITLLSIIGAQKLKQLGESPVGDGVGNPSVKKRLKQAWYKAMDSLETKPPGWEIDSANGNQHITKEAVLKKTAQTMTTAALNVWSASLQEAPAIAAGLAAAKINPLSEIDESLAILALAGSYSLLIAAMKMNADQQMKLVEDGLPCTSATAQVFYDMVSSVSESKTAHKAAFYTGFTIWQLLMEVPYFISAFKLPEAISYFDPQANTQNIPYAFLAGANYFASAYGFTQGGIAKGLNRLKEVIRDSLNKAKDR